MCHSRMLTIQGPTCGQCKVPEGDNAPKDEEHPCGWHQRFQISWTVDRRIKVQVLQRTGSWRRVARCVDVADAGQQSEEAECRGAADAEDTDDGTIDNAEVVKSAEQNDGSTTDQVQKKCLVTGSPTWSITGSCRRCVR